MVRAKLSVPAGAPFHEIAGDVFLPVQPMPLNALTSGIRALAAMPVAESVNCACAVRAAAAVSAAAASAVARREDVRFDIAIGSEAGSDGTKDRQMAGLNASGGRRARRLTGRR